MLGLEVYVNPKNTHILGIVMETMHKKKKPVISENLNSWKNQSCCLERQNCMGRQTWVNIQHPTISYINMYGLNVALGIPI